MPMVLVADDSYLSRQTLVKLLKEENYEVAEAVNGKDTIEKILKQPPDCLLLDLLMPEMDGFAVLNALGKKGLLVSVIVVSADIQDTTRAKCHELGAVGFLNKPSKANEVLGAVRKALASRKGISG